MRDRPARDAIVAELQSPAFARAYTLTALTAGFLTAVLHRTVGTVTLATIVTGLACLGVAVLVARRDELSLVGFAPTSLVLFLAWTLASVAWALDGARGRTLAAWLALVGWAVVAITIAHVRDTLQIARAVGDVLRWLLTLSLALEVLSGIVIDVPFTALGITGDIAFGGPVQGLFASRNLLAFVAVVALVTFTIEWRSRSVPRHVAGYSLILAALLAVLSSSPTAFVLLVMMVVATAALGIARLVPLPRRRTAQVAIAAAAVIGFIGAFAMRGPIVRFLSARSGFTTRADLWTQMIEWIRHRPITGWSWFGTWEDEPFPTNIVNLSLGSPNASALSAYFDVLLQLGWVGLLLFSLLILLALARAWLAASDRRSVVYAWLPLMLVALLVESVFESYALSDLGWLLLVICAVRAGQERSWRIALDPTAPLPPPRGLPRP
ncbi:O-antigen ligase family protein [Microbacterium sp. gxy059]|uniref:O-antigen ligase family protein n=1 Tax=Microbacterium sp. gxy059 TaxID=2957199 RepID=UPI003D98FB3E